MRKKILQQLLLLVISITTYAQVKKVQSKPLIIGNIDQLYSNVLAENRVLNIYLPEGYKDTGSTRYPVIYILDGSIDEDFFHIAGIVQYNNFPWINRVPK